MNGDDADDADGGDDTFAADDRYDNKNPCYWYLSILPIKCFFSAVIFPCVKCPVDVKYIVYLPTSFINV